MSYHLRPWRLGAIAGSGTVSEMWASNKQAIWSAAVGAALAKLRDGGCVVVSRKLQEYLSAPWVDVVDESGAGDAFACTLAIALV